MEKKVRDKEERRLLKEQNRQQGINIEDDEEESEEEDMDKEIDEGLDYGEEVVQSAKLPSINDPKLWQVRVKKGYERIAAMALMNKMIDFANKGKPL